MRKAARAGLALRRRLCTDAMPAPDCVKFEHVVQAHHRCRKHLVSTNILHSHWLSLETGSQIVLKMEQQQFTGSFKERGACNALLSLSSEARQAGVKAASAGNHGALATGTRDPPICRSADPAFASCPVSTGTGVSRR